MPKPLRLPRTALSLALLLAPPAMAADLDGAWRLESGELVDASGKTLDYADLELDGLKVIGDGRFSFAINDGGKFWAGGGGSYVADDSHYAETLHMASFPLEGDGTYRFRYTLEGDTWTLERHDAEGRRVEREVWRRVDAKH